MSKNTLYERQAERRKIAAQVLAGMWSNPEHETSSKNDKDIAFFAIQAADALITELDRREAEELKDSDEAVKS